MKQLAGQVLRLPVIMLACVWLCAFPARADDTLYLATSTTIEASGLLARVQPAFERQTGHKLSSMVVGSGRALLLARQGLADVVWTHAPVEENLFIEQGYGLSRGVVMSNDFLLVGPAADPAGVQGETDILTAMRKIADSRQLYVSRGDGSGTHRKELALWEQLGLSPYASWYYEAGTGMTAALQIASEKQAYTLVDKGSWLANRKDLDLRPISRGDPRLHNVYSLIVVDPQHFSRSHNEHAETFVRWMLGEQGRKIISSLQIDGEPLFDLPPATD